jgi:hypothetical protein
LHHEYCISSGTRLIIASIFEISTLTGDTLTKSFVVTRIRNTSDKNHSIIHFTCDLINQRGRLCMRADKRMLFQFPVPPSNFTTHGQPPGSIADDEKIDTHLFRDHLLSKAATVLANQPSHSLAHLEPGMLVLHSLHRSLTFSQSQQLASLARLTHARHFDCRKYDRASEIFVPGGLVLGITISACARDLHEVLHEEIQSCAYVNHLHPDNMVGAISYVHSVEDHLPGDLELVTVTTLGIKNINVTRDLAEVDIPVELFQPGIFSKEIEKICREACPVLSGLIVVAGKNNAGCFVVPKVNFFFTHSSNLLAPRLSTPQLQPNERFCDRHGIMQCFSCR